MRYIKLFTIFTLLQAIIWVASHFYWQAHSREILLVVDTSYAMKQHFGAVDKWIDQFDKQSRYSTIRVGTDKADLGPLQQLSAREAIYRTSFGKFNEKNLAQLYSKVQVDKKYLLTNSGYQDKDWTIVAF